MKDPSGGATDRDDETPESGRASPRSKANVRRHRVPLTNATQQLLDIARRAVPTPGQSLVMQGWTLDGVVAGRKGGTGLPQGDRQPARKAGTDQDSADPCGIVLTVSPTCTSVFPFPEPSYSFETDREFRDEVLTFGWDPVFTMDQALTNADIDGMFRAWEVPSGEGAFLEGPRRTFVRWAIRLIDLFRDEIPEQGEFCPEARTKVSERLDAKDYAFHANDDSGDRKSVV